MLSFSDTESMTSWYVVYWLNIFFWVYTPFLRRRIDTVTVRGLFACELIFVLTFFIIILFRCSCLLSFCLISQGFYSLHFMFTSILFLIHIRKGYVGTLVSQPENYNYSIICILPTFWAINLDTSLNSYFLSGYLLPDEVLTLEVLTLEVPTLEVLTLEVPTLEVLTLEVLTLEVPTTKTPRTS